MDKEINIVCKTHGMTRFLLQGNGKFKRYRCAKCGVVAVDKRRKLLKLKAIEYKGGKCVKCSYNKSVWALEFHHTDPTKKDFGIGYKGYTRSWENVKLELDKCILVCCNCHAEIHEELHTQKSL